MTPCPSPLRQRAARAGVPLLLLAALAALPSAASASTAANTRITNTVTVNYNDASGVAQTAVTASATVTVTLVPAAPTVSSPAAFAIAQGATATLSYSVTANANGQDTYDLATTVTPGNMSAVTATVQASIALGGTTLAVAANDGDPSIVVPYDGTTDGAVNGIVVGRTVVVNGNAYQVASVTENAGSNTTTIGLSAPIAGGTVAAGQIVGERRTFGVTFPSGTVQSGGSGTQTASTTATSQSGSRPAGTQATPTVVTVNRPTLTVTKLVSIDGGANFVAAANAAPGTTLVYKITATNTGATPASAVAFTDQIPAYLTYVAGSARYSTSATDDYAAAAGNALTEGSGGYAYDAGTTTLTYDPGAGIGDVAGGAVLVLFYRAGIN